MDEDIHNDPILHLHIPQSDDEDVWFRQYQVIEKKKRKNSKFLKVFLGFYYLFSIIIIILRTHFFMFHGEFK